ncbi:hypothetical protein RYX36_031213 [Vicia faba]
MPVTAPKGDMVYTKLDRYYGEDQATKLNSGGFPLDLALEPISVLFERLDEETFVKYEKAASILSILENSIVLTKVDANEVKNKDIASGYEVKGFPTIKISLCCCTLDM